MSTIIKLNESNCRNCYKCIRECPIKAIAFEQGHVGVIPDECVLCGKCIECCPQNAKYIKTHIVQVKELLEGNKPVYISVAPSWLSWYGTDDFGKVSAALKALGFAHVEETAIGARETSREYAELLGQWQFKHIITTACPSVVMLIERHFPSLIKALAPVSSPMMAHARLMRETYGDIKVVFVGPCLSKIHESEDPLAGGLVNAVLTFEELDQWMSLEKISLDTQDPTPRGMTDPTPRLYPKPGGILATIPKESFAHYTPMAIDGFDRCLEFFASLEQRPDTPSLFVEANLCSGGCIGGPILRMRGNNHLTDMLQVTGKTLEADSNPAQTNFVEFPHPRVFANRTPKNPPPTEEELQVILASIGKLTPEQELNCGSCGYPTCRAKAEAVFHGKADVSMCLPYLRDRAENMSNMVMEHSPNGIIAFDRDLCVQDINPRALELFQTNRQEAVGMPLPAFYGEQCFEEAHQTHLPVSKKMFFQDVNRTLHLVVVYISEHKQYLAIVRDISEEEKNKKFVEDLRLNTMEVAQNVIEKQMRVAQEIASLLGETTAETKVALTNLKKSLNNLGDN